MHRSSSVIEMAVFLRLFSKVEHGCFPIDLVIKK